MKKIIFMMCAILASTLMAKAEECGATSTETIDCGVPTQFTIKAISSDTAQYVFDKWPDGNTDTVRVITLEVSKDTTITALFKDRLYTVNVTNGSSDKENYKYNEDITITAGDAPNCERFKEWQYKGVKVESAPEIYTFKATYLNTVGTYVAIYEKTPLNVTVSTDETKGSVCIAPYVAPSPAPEK